MFSKILRIIANTRAPQTLAAVKYYAMNILMWGNWKILLFYCFTFSTLYQGIKKSTIFKKIAGCSFEILLVEWNLA